MSFPIAAFAGGGLIVIMVNIMIVLAVTYGFYTFKGSAINAHPATGLDAHPALRTQPAIGQRSHQRRQR